MTIGPKTRLAQAMSGKARELSQKAHSYDEYWSLLASFAIDFMNGTTDEPSSSQATSDEFHITALGRESLDSLNLSLPNATPKRPSTGLKRKRQIARNKHPVKSRTRSLRTRNRAGLHNKRSRSLSKK